MRRADQRLSGSRDHSRRLGNGHAMVRPYGAHSISIRMRAFLKALVSWLFSSGRPSDPTPANQTPVPPRYSTVILGSQHEAVQAAKNGLVLAIVESGGRRKWAMLRCPCGCGEVLAMNLMSTHRPRWDVRVTASGDASLYPSVDSTKCGAHFWLKQGRIVWAVPSRPHHS